MILIASRGALLKLMPHMAGKFRATGPAAAKLMAVRSISKGLAVACGAISNFVMCKYVVFT